MSFEFLSWKEPGEWNHCVTNELSVEHLQSQYLHLHWKQSGSFWLNETSDHTPRKGYPVISTKLAAGLFFYIAFL